MDPNSLRARLEELGLNPNQIDSVMLLLAEQHKAPPSAVLRASEDYMIAIELEPDPYKRAALVALMISQSYA